MNNTRRSFNMIGGILLLVFMVIGLVLFLDNFTQQPMGANHNIQPTYTPVPTSDYGLYPAPEKILAPSINDLAYPGPTELGNQPTSSSSQPTTTPGSGLLPQATEEDPAMATVWALKLRYTPSLTEIARGATEMASLSIRSTPPPTPIPIRYQIRTADDVLKAVLNHPFYGNVNISDFGPCLKAGQPGKAFFVRSLQSNLNDYYILPFFQNGEVCSVYLVGIKDGMGTVMGGGEGKGLPYTPQSPFISADQARSLVEGKTGQKVVAEPELVFQHIQEFPPDLFNPFWLVTTANGQSYYLIHNPGFKDKPAGVVIYNVKDVTPIG